MAPSGVPVFLLFCRLLRTGHSSGVLSPLVILLISRSIPGGWSADEIRTADTVRGADGGKCLDHTMYDGETRTFFDNDRTIVVHHKIKEKKKRFLSLPPESSFSDYGHDDYGKKNVSVYLYTKTFFFM